MTKGEAIKRLDEFRALRTEPGQDEKSLLEAALFLEDNFGLRLTDDEISKNYLGSHSAIKKFLFKRLGVE